MTLSIVNMTLPIALRSTVQHLFLCAQYRQYRSERPQHKRSIAALFRDGDTATPCGGGGLGTAADKLSLPGPLKQMAGRADLTRPPLQGITR